MNILFTSDLSGMGGGETSLVNICNVLKKDNTLIVICACRGNLVDILNKEKIKTYVIDYRNKSRLIHNMYKIRKIIKDEKIEVIHNNDPLTSIIFYYASFGLKIRNYWTCHGQWYSFSPLKKVLIKRSTKYIFCVSSKVQESLKKMGFENTGVTYLGIPLSKYEGAIPSQFRKKFGIKEGTVLITSFGRFQRIKGQLKLVKAIEKLIKEHSNIMCLLVGGCVYNNDEEKKYLHEIEEYVEKYNLQEYIKFVGERKDVPSIMHEADLVVIPSDNESFGMVAIEALASGTPVISTPNDGVSEILEYRKEFIAETNDVEGLYMKINQYLSSEDVRNAAVSFAIKRKKDFAIERIAGKYIDVFFKDGGM